MLVLTRSANQEVSIGPDVVVKVLKVRGHKVQLGIEAPRDKKILRGELDDFGDTTGNPMPVPSTPNLDAPNLELVA